MKLLLFNGSPKKNRSNTQSILDHFIKGYLTNDKNTITQYYLMEENRFDEYCKKMEDADLIMIAFPLYVLSMPGIVKSFIEILPENKATSKKIFYLIQSGFPDTHQCEPLEKYLKKLSLRLNYVYLGTIIKGFGAGLEMVDKDQNSEWLQLITRLGTNLALKGYLDHKIIEELKEPYQLSSIAMAFQKILSKIGIFDIYAREQLKKYKITEKQSYGRPLCE